MNLEPTILACTKALAKMGGADVLGEYVAKRRAEDEADFEIGKALAANSSEAGGPSRLAKIVAGFLQGIEQGVSPDCHKLLQEWAIDHYWGRKLMAADMEGRFLAAHKQLTELGASFEKRLTFGDADYGIWAVTTEDALVIASECYCSCADDNIHLWILSPLHFESYRVSHKGEGGTLQYADYAADWNGYGYRDSRDKSYCFNYDYLTGRIESALSHYDRIHWSHWYFGIVEEALEKPEFE